MAKVSRRHAMVGAASLAALAAAPALAAEPAAGDMSLGDPKAPVKVVEYASLSCSHCARFATEVFPAFKAKYIDTGKVHFTLKELLTPPAQVAMAGFMMARCAGPTKYFKVVDEVFRSQSRWQDGTIKPIFLEIASANGLSEAQFEACLADEPAQAALNERVRKVIEEDKVNSTPTFFINGQPFTGSVATLTDLDAAIAAANPGGR